MEESRQQQECGDAIGINGCERGRTRERDGSNCVGIRGREYCRAKWHERAAENAGGAVG